jgi:two-component system chemotaxis response regulator CheY
MKKVILIADDSPTIRKFVSFSLKAQGFDVIVACDGMEAVEMLPTRDVDLIITDLNMPNMDGFELIKAVRENDNNKDIPIIILSSLKGSEEIERGLGVGANSYMVKPFDPKRIQFLHFLLMRKG